MIFLIKKSLKLREIFSRLHFHRNLDLINYQSIIDTLINNLLYSKKNQNIIQNLKKDKIILIFLFSHINIFSSTRKNISLDQKNRNKPLCSIYLINKDFVFYKNLDQESNLQRQQRVYRKFLSIIQRQKNFFSSKDLQIFLNTSLNGL